jgi:hypothetical protein
MAHLLRHVRLALLPLALSGCIGEIEDSTTADDEAVLDHIEALGHSRDSAAIRDEHVIVDGDMRFKRDALLRGEYEQLVEVDEEHALVDKGYRYPGIIAAKNRGNVRLIFANGTYAPTKVIRDAFIAAAKSWSSVPGSSIRISPDNTGPAIVVRTVPAARFEKYSGCVGTDACADAPLNGRPGYEIFIRAESVHEGCEKWGGSNLINVTRHELGHALGFAHPKEKGSKHIDKTAGCASSVSKCLFEPGYSTIMAGPDVGAKCSFTPARLTKDDYATTAATYPAR